MEVPSSSPGREARKGPVSWDGLREHPSGGRDPFEHTDPFRTRISENPLPANFGEPPFHALG
jgi:hypothetical protein